MGNRGWLRPTKSFAKAIFRELTDRYYSLPALALATIEEDPAISSCLFEDFPAVGLDEEAQKVIFRAWLRQNLERRSFRPDGAETSDLGEGRVGAVGINAAHIARILPNNFGEYLTKALDDAEAVEKVGAWFQRVVREKGLLHFENDLYFLQLHGLTLNLRLDGAWLRCQDCGRIHPEVLANTCPACLGQVVDADPDYLDARTGFYRRQVQRAFDPPRPRALRPLRRRALRPTHRSARRERLQQSRRVRTPLPGRPSR